MPTGDLPGAAGVVCFEWSTQADFSDAQRTPFQPATDEQRLHRAGRTHRPEAEHHLPLPRRLWSHGGDGPDRPELFVQDLAGRSHRHAGALHRRQLHELQQIPARQLGKAGGPLTATEDGQTSRLSSLRGDAETAA